METVSLYFIFSNINNLYITTYMISLMLLIKLFIQTKPKLMNSYEN